MSRRSRAGTAKKCTKKRDARAELLFCSLKGHLQPVCIAVVHFTEIICCNTEITKVISVFDNRIVSMFVLKRVSQPAVG